MIASRLAAAALAAAVVVAAGCSRGPDAADAAAAAMLAPGPQDGVVAPANGAAPADDAAFSPNGAKPPGSGDVGVPATVEATYDCTPGDREMPVRFDNRADTATATIDGRTVTMTGQRPASGIWYSGDGFDLRGKGRQARLGLPDGGERTCMAR